MGDKLSGGAIFACRIAKKWHEGKKVPHHVIGLKKKYYL